MPSSELGAKRARLVLQVLTQPIHVSVSNHKWYNYHPSFHQQLIDSPSNTTISLKNQPLVTALALFTKSFQCQMILVKFF